MKTPDPITSLENQWFRRFRKALDSHDDEIVFEGPKQIRDAIAGGLEALAVATTAAGAKALTAPLSVSPLLFSDRLFEKLAATSSSQGILALFKRPQTTLEGLLALRLPLVALDSIQDPGNVGTIIRNAAAFDMGGVLVVGETADPFSQRSIRASAGAILSIGICGISRAELPIAAVRAGYELFAAEPGGDPHIDEVPETAILIFGNEGKGVSAELLGAARRLSVPMSERVESLNVASATAILLSKLYEHRNSPGFRRSPR